MHEIQHIFLRSLRSLAPFFEFCKNSRPSPPPLSLSREFRLLVSPLPAAVGAHCECGCSRVEWGGCEIEAAHKYFGLGACLQITLFLMHNTHVGIVCTFCTQTHSWKSGHNKTEHSKVPFARLYPLFSQLIWMGCRSSINQFRQDVLRPGIATGQRQTMERQPRLPYRSQP